MNVSTLSKAVQTQRRLNGEQTTRLTVGVALLSATLCLRMLAYFAL